MQIGKMNLQTIIGMIEVEVEVLNPGPRPGTIWVRALNGRPFDGMSHGGPVQNDTALVHLERLRDLREVRPLNQAPDAFLETQYEDRTWISDES